MIIESLINNFISIPSNAKHGFGFRLELAKIDKIAADARFNYATELKYYIADLIKKENNLDILKYLIEKYGPMLKEEHKLIVCLYKRYLTLNPTNEQYYKDLAEAIVFYRSESEKLKAQKMYEFAQDRNYDEAAKILDSINY